MEKAKFWYETDEKSNPVLVTEDGKRFTVYGKYEDNRLEVSLQERQGWQRAMLYMDYNGIWDATQFGAWMSATLAYGPDSEGKFYTFSSCKLAERHLYESLSKKQVEECRRNVEEFYSSRELQLKWQEIILHPICVVTREDGGLEPVTLSDINPEILEKYEHRPIKIGRRGNYD